MVLRRSAVIVSLVLGVGVFLGRANAQQQQQGEEVGDNWFTNDGASGAQEEYLGEFGKDMGGLLPLSALDAGHWEMFRTGQSIRQVFEEHFTNLDQLEIEVLANTSLSAPLFLPKITWDQTTKSYQGEDYPTPVTEYDSGGLGNMLPLTTYWDGAPFAGISGTINGAAFRILIPSTPARNSSLAGRMVTSGASTTTKTKPNLNSFHRAVSSTPRSAT